MKRLLRDQRGLAPVIVVLIIFGVIVVGGVGAGAVILSNDLAITVNNQSCGTIDIAKGSAALGFNFLPGINVPEKIEEGETVKVQVPRQFIDSVTIGNGTVEIIAFDRTFNFGTSAINMQASTLDGTPLASLAGNQIDISEDHSLVLVCR
ncbi:MAG: hypothetical protein JSU58_01095 [Dehalococcoidales bacterium]|nr:MAG: hypothetical protein JSU58_01095 [Dehalococcoidales bacterium]